MRLLNEWIARVDRSANLMGRMMRRLDVDIATVAQTNMGNQLRGMASRCRACPVADTCERWLNGGEAGLSHHDFCRNASAFEAFRVH